MKNDKKIRFSPSLLTLSLGLSALLSATDGYAQSTKKVENLSRGLIAVPASNGVLVSWRRLINDANNASFDVYRNGVKINAAPITTKSNFLDTSPVSGATYSLRLNGNAVASAQAWSQSYLNVPISKPSGGTTPSGESYTYVANDATLADVDGDGNYEIILKWDPTNAKDNAQSGYTGNVFIDAYTLSGTRLWRIDLGRNIRAGAHYTQMIAYDFDGDGKAELAVKTADGTIDGKGNVIGVANADYRNSSGYILSGPEFLTMFEGSTGKALKTIDYVPQRGTVSSWGDNYGNRVDRFLGGVAYLNGQTPSLIMARGYYTRAVVAAFDWNGQNFSQRWVFDTNSNSQDAKVAGQGAHSLSVADVDNDGRDEIIYGAATIDDGGNMLYSTALGHGDALHVTDVDPNRPGLEVYMVHESASSYTKNGVEYGVELHDAATGQILWSRPSSGADVGRGITADIDPRYVGNESWASRGGLVAANGQLISESRPSPMNFAVWWDGDLLRELLDGTTISKWNHTNNTTSTLLAAANFNAVSNNGTKATPTISADIFGDWREEVVWANNTSTALMIFSTPIPSDHGMPTLMQNPQYRTAIAWQNVGYNQPPHPNFYLGHHTSSIPSYGAVVVNGGSSSSAASSTSSASSVSSSVASSSSSSAPSYNVYTGLSAYRVWTGGISVSWNLTNLPNNVRAIELYRNDQNQAAGRTRVVSGAATNGTFQDNGTFVQGITYWYMFKITLTDNTVINTAPEASTYYW